MNAEDILSVLFGGALFLFWLAMMAVAILAAWRLFTKAGKPGWAAIVPIYNAIVMLEIIGRPLWFLILFFIPLVNIIAAIVVWLDLAKSFGRSTAFGIGLIFLTPIFLLILAFGDARYLGPAAKV